MKVIGLTGGIGSGKSTISKFLAEMGAVIINADEVGHEALKPDSEAWHQVVAAFGRQVLSADGSIDRQKLGEIVFGHPGGLSRLNRIMHPRMYDMVRERLEEHRRRGAGVVVLEAPLLLEAGWTSLVDEVWVTTAPEAVVLERLKRRSGLSPTESRSRIRSQLSPAERVKHADVVIATDVTPEQLRSRLKALWQEVLSRGS